MTTPPKWATDLVSKIASDFPAPQAMGNPKPAPRVTWHHTTKRATHSTGHLKFIMNQLHVTAGTEQLLQYITVLHEMAHWYVGIGHGHDWTFWSTFIRMCDHYAVADEHVLAHVKWVRGGKRVVSYVEGRILKKQGRVKVMVATSSGLKLAASVAAS